MPEEDPKNFSFVIDWLYQDQGKDFKAAFVDG